MKHKVRLLSNTVSSKTFVTYLNRKLYKMVDDSVIVFLFYCAYIKVALLVIKTEQIHPFGTYTWPP